MDKKTKAECQEVYDSMSLKIKEMKIKKTS